MQKLNLSKPAVPLSVLISAVALLGSPRLGLAQDAGSPTPSDRARAAEEMKQGAMAFRARKYDEAQRHYRSAFTLDPSQKTALVLLARSIRAQYKPGVKDPRNLAKAKEAIATYEQALEADPNQDEAFAAVIDLYGALDQNGKKREWLLKRAGSVQLAKQKRSAAYRGLLELGLNCVQESGNSAAAADQCGAEGLRAADNAISLGGDEEPILVRKAQLLREMARTARSSGGAATPEAYEQQALAAEKRVTELREQARKKSESLPTY
jgi:tetratricopeptide (TPR) repeat protein